MIATLSLRVTIVSRLRVDCGREHFVADSVDAHVGPLDESLKLRWTPTNIVDARHVVVSQRLHDRTYTADRLVNNPAVPRTKRTHQLRIVRDQRLRHFEAVALDEQRLTELRKE